MPAMALPISASTALVGVLGDPVRHSLSPAMHNAALAALGLDWVYLALPTPSGDLATVVRALEALDCRGLNVTLPHKQAVTACCAELTPLAARVGAVNTLVRRQAGGWLGTNTDVEGFLTPLRRDGLDWSGQGAVVLGCGGSARAVVAGLVELGCGSIAVVGRRPDALERFADGCRAWAPQLGIHSWEQLGALLPGCRLLVNTTPVGMASPADPTAARACPLDGPDLAALPTRAWVYDLIYTPRPSQLLRAAEARGCSTLDGLEMLVQQGAASLRLWSGAVAVPVEAMRAAAERQLAAA
jgi:shikimate dehydrogenase